MAQLCVCACATYLDREQRAATNTNDERREQACNREALSGAQKQRLCVRGRRACLFVIVEVIIVCVRTFLAVEALDIVQKLGVDIKCALCASALAHASSDYGSAVARHLHSSNQQRRAA